MKKDKKIILIVMASLVIIFIGISIILSIVGGKTIYLGTNTRINIKNGIIYISNKDEKVNRKNVKIYFDKQIIDGYVLTEEESSTGLNNSLHAYSNDGEFLQFELGLIAYTKDLKIKFIDIDEDYTTDIHRIKKYTDYKNIDINSNTLDYATISSFDIDNDDELEYIYSIGLINEDTYYSKVIMLKDNRFYTIVENTGDNDEDSTRLELLSIMDIDNDNDYEYVIVKNNSEYGPSTYELYNFDESEFNKIGIEQ